MQNWEIFENECVSYLEGSFTNSDFQFVSSGGANSSVSDIEVYDNEKNNVFDIEVKLSPCQSGQFVTVVKKGQFILSPRNKFKNSFSNKIIILLNENFEFFNKVEQAALDLCIDDDVLYSWIKEHYKSKNSLFIITSEVLKGYKAIIPIDDLEKYFEISACLRRKKSGTSNVSKSGQNEAIIELKKSIPHGEKIREVLIGDKIFIEFENKSKLISRANRNIGDSYFLSPDNRGFGYYTLRKKSKTNNINVIFSLNYKGSKKNSGLDLLKKKLV